MPRQLLGSSVPADEELADIRGFLQNLQTGKGIAQQLLQFASR